MVPRQTWNLAQESRPTIMCKINFGLGKIFKNQPKKTFLCNFQARNVVGLHEIIGASLNLSTKKLTTYSKYMDEENILQSQFLDKNVAIYVVISYLEKN